MALPERSLRAEGRVSRVLTSGGPGTAPAACVGPRALRREGEAQALRSLSPSPFPNLGGRRSPSASLPQGWAEPASGEGPVRPPAPPRSSNTLQHKTMSRQFCDPGPAGFWRSVGPGAVRRAQLKKKQIDLVASPLPLRLGYFLVDWASARPRPLWEPPWAPEVQAFGLGRWQMRCFLLREGRLEEEACSRFCSLVECETPAKHAQGRTS